MMRVRAKALAGNGRAFSAGADIKAIDVALQSSLCTALTLEVGQ
jgi:enoyl-CoA hydratase/carnithine racemase